MAVNVFKQIFARPIAAYALMAAVFAFSVNWAKVQEERSRYLLGIFYNGDFKNYKDGLVYFDYLRRQNLSNADYWAAVGYSYEKLERMDLARPMYTKALDLNPGSQRLIDRFEHGLVAITEDGRLLPVRQ